MNREELEQHLPELYEAAQRFAQRLLASRGSRDVDAHEIAAEAIVRLIEHPERIKDEHAANLERYLFAVIHRMVIDSFRRIARQKMRLADLDEVAAVPDMDALANQELLHELTAAIRSLPERERAVIQMQLQGSTTKEIATSLGLHAAQVARIKLRAMDALRKAVESGAGPDDPRKKLTGSPEPTVLPEHSLSLVFDADVSRDLVAEFLAELSHLYSELSGGDELVIREGKIPTELGVLV